MASTATSVAARVSTRTVPPTTAPYVLCQAAGWSAFLIYVLVAYFVFAPEHQAADVISIVFFCTIPPVLLTHRLRAWMYANGWSRMTEWRRKARQVAAALACAFTVTAAVGGANGVVHGCMSIPVQGMGWMLFAYVVAFGAWLWIYEMVHERRRRDELERLARDAQLRALRAQMNPHFLFNSLNSVRSLITENPARAADMVTGLSDILRYSLASDRRETVPFADELGVIEEYLAVERVRFEDRLRLEQTIDPRASSLAVPPMIVQTLVENAVKHGISATAGGGLVRLDARVRDHRLEVVVRNTGRFQPAIDGGGFGLRNAAERLQLLYGERASLTVEQEAGAAGEETVATLVLPVEAVR